MALPCSIMTASSLFVTNPSTKRGRPLELSKSDMKDLTYRQR